MNYFFLYTTATGAIYGSPYLGSADEWTNIPDGCEVLGPFAQETADATVVDAYAHPNHYTVQSGQLVQVANYDALRLKEAQNAKIAELYAKRDETIEAGFTGTNGHKYFFGNPDQKKVQGKIALLGVNALVTSVGWLTKDAGFITHTRDEFIQVATDADQFETDQHMKCYQLENQVWATTTIDQVNAIVW